MSEAAAHPTEPRAGDGQEAIRVTGLGKFVVAQTGVATVVVP